MNEALKHKPDTLGVHFAVNIFIGTTILWLILRDREGLNPIWAIASLIAASDPVVKKAVKTFHGRIVNALIGCGTGFFVLVVGGTSEWKIPLALSLSVLISAYLVRVEVMFRQAPITAAIIVAGGLMQHSKEVGMRLGLLRIGEVLFGCVIGLLVSWLMSILWPPRTSAAAPQPVESPKAAGQRHPSDRMEPSQKDQMQTKGRNTDLGSLTGTH